MWSLSKPDQSPTKHENNVYGSEENLEIQQIAIHILVIEGAYKNFLYDEFFSDDKLAYAIGLKRWVDGKKNYCKKNILQELKKRLREQQGPIECLSNPSLNEHIKQLSVTFGLSPTETLMLRFMVLAKTNETLLSVFRLSDSVPLEQLPRIIASVLSLSESEVTHLISKKSKLTTSGIIDHGHFSSLNLSATDHIEFSSKYFSSLMISSFPVDIMELFRDIFHLATPAKLDLDDFEFLADKLSFLTNLFNTSIQSSRIGTNILIYGKPGMGKTEIAKIVAKQLDLPLYVISSEDSDGDYHSSSKRLQAFRIAQTIFKESENLILFDEVEDVFSRSDSYRPAKGWFNTMLENNTTPCIWISNDVSMIDPAFIRRFDFVLEVKTKTQNQRERLIKHISGKTLDNDTINTLASSEQLTPGILAKAIEVATLTQQSSNDLLGLSKQVKDIVENTLVAQGHCTLNTSRAIALPAFYHTSFINVDRNLPSLISGIKKYHNVRLFFSGPSGTGKTAFAHWVATQLDKPLLKKQVSDLISPYVGETERNLALAFREATESDSVLLFDEVDSFLQSRANAHHSWEVTAVNEMLTQLESYTGLCIATTNLPDTLDKASLRRFDLKLHFDFLTHEQALQLLTALLDHLGISEKINDLHSQRLSTLHNLTPGDFCILSRQSRFNPILSISSALDELIHISTEKDGKHGTIGFVH